MKEYQFARALLHAQYDLDRFQLSLKRLSSQDFPSPSIAKRIEFLEGLLSDTENKLEAIKRDFSEDSQGASERLVSEIRKLIQNRRQLEVVDRARSDEVPWSLVPSVEKLAKQLIPGKEILLTSLPDMNYMVSWHPSHHFVTVYLPGLHRANAFLHILVGHELFHPIVEPFVHQEQANIESNLRDECKKLFGKSNQPLLDQHRLDQIIETTLECWRQGLRELMCDMGAAALFGPAALWTLSSFAAINLMDIEPSPATEFYPPWRLRIKTVVDYLVEHEKLEDNLMSLANELRKASHEDHATALLTGYENEAKVASEQTFNPKNPLVKIAYNQIDRSLANAKNEVKRLSEKYSGKWTTSLDEIPHLIGRLKLKVPPSEIVEPGKRSSKSASFTAILIACWIERLFRESAALALDDYREVCRLTLKAIEDSNLKSEFLEWKAGS